MSTIKQLWKHWSKGALTLISALTLAACSSGDSSSSSSQTSNDINWYTPTEIITLDISKMTDQYSSLAVGNSSSNFFRMNDKGEPLPDLATGMEVSADGLTYTVTLRDGLKWSDGSDLTAEDFVYTWQRLVDPKTAAEYAYLVSEVAVSNADAVMAGDKPVTDLGVRSDGNKVIFTLNNPSPAFTSMLTFSTFAPQKKSFVEAAGSDYGTSSEQQLYSGPYTVENWNGTSGDFTLVKNEYYWDAKNVKTDKVNVQTVKKPDTAVQMYKQGDLDFADISDTTAIYAANSSNPDVVNVLNARTSYLVYNETGTVPALANQKIRQALNLATDREALVKAAVDTGALPAKSLLPVGLQTLPDGTDLNEHVVQNYAYNKEEAQKLFREGMKELGLDSLTLTMTADADRPTTKAAVDYLKQAWEEVFDGFTLEEKFVTFKQRLDDTKNQNFEMAFVAWGGDYPEGSTFYGLFTSTAAYNYGKVHSEAYDKAYKDATVTNALDAQAAAHNYKAAEAALYEGAHYNPLFHMNSKGLQNPKIKGLVRRSTGLNVDFTYAHKD